MKQLILLFLLTCIGCSSQAQQTETDVQLLDMSLLIKDNVLYKYFRQAKEGLYVYTDTSQSEIDFFIENSLFELPNRSIYATMSDSVLLSLVKPNAKKFNYWEVLDESSFDTIKKTLLNGVKIALDPGHVALDMQMAEIEGKYLKIDNLELFESNLTLRTAYKLKDLLENEGAEVFVTRNENGLVHKGITYDDWLSKDFYRVTDSLYKLDEIDSVDVIKLTKYYKGDTDYGRKVIFHKVFKHLDTRHRAKIINEWKPDVTLVMHYNVDEENIPWKETTTKNYAMAFVPGSFCAGELSTTEDRFEFLRILLSENNQTSSEVSKEVIQSVSIQLSIPLADTHDATYLSTYCQKVDKGLYARNLALTRLIRSPVCYAEGLYQDNEKEITNLTKDDDRIEEVAKAYFMGLKNYYAK